MDGIKRIWVQHFDSRHSWSLQGIIFNIAYCDLVIIFSAPFRLCFRLPLTLNDGSSEWR